MKIRNINAQITQRYHFFVFIFSVLVILISIILWGMYRFSYDDSLLSTSLTTIAIEDIRQGGEISLYGTLYKKRIADEDVYVIFADNDFKVLLASIDSPTDTDLRLGTYSRYDVQIQDFWNAIPRVVIQDVVAVSADTY